MHVNYSLPLHHIGQILYTLNTHSIYCISLQIVWLDLDYDVEEKIKGIVYGRHIVCDIECKVELKNDANDKAA